MLSDYCDCAEDGFCPRYQRLMGGRLREVCAGVNVDLGTAAAFREQWRREVSMLPASKQCRHCEGGKVRIGFGGRHGYGPPIDCPVCKGTGLITIPPKPLLLKTGQAPGDAVAMTSAIYSLHRAHPGKYLTAVESYWPEAFEHNPDIAWHRLPTAPPLEDGYADVEMHYPAIHQSNERGIHFMQAWCEHLGAALGVDVPLATDRPRLYFADPAPPVEDFWLVCSGGKRDFTNKLWGHHNYQTVVDMLKDKVKFVQVGGARPVVPWDARTAGSQVDSHPRLGGTADMVGRTTLRELFDLARRARGVLCGVSLLMHVAAAVGRPAVVVAGGREPVAWNAYPAQQYVHTVGALPCRDAQGRVGGACWRYRVVPLGDGTVCDRDTCERPMGGLPQCMQMISPNEVAGLVLRYNKAT